MADNGLVLIVGESAGGALSAGTLELLGGGRGIADRMNAGLALALLGEGLGPLAETAIAYGADVVYLAEDRQLETYEAETYLQPLERLVARVQPDVVLMGHTSVGRDLAPRLAYRLKTGLSMDCVQIAVDPGSGLLHMTRPVYGCKAMAVMACAAKPRMATVRPAAMEPIEPDLSRRGEIVPVEADIDRSLVRAKIVERVEEHAKGVPLEHAQVVVCGGRGMGTAESFFILEELAELLGGAVGGSRPPCDAGWVPSTRQVGLTGKIVRPDLYIAVALSGASQHMAGCSSSRTIVAINRDPEANIFSSAHYGVVGDYREILPPFIERVREIMKK
jgi:electron transfer flavoprotein alpha subunit